MIIHESGVDRIANLNIFNHARFSCHVFLKFEYSSSKIIWSNLMEKNIECKQIYFNYRDRRYLVELWKGQYGIFTGAEIKVYVTDKEGKFELGIMDESDFKCIDKTEYLYLYFSLKKDDIELFHTSDRNWRLSSFSMTDYFAPSELTMEVEIMFQNQTMCYAFYEGLRNAGYDRKDIIYCQNVVSFRFGNS